MDALAALRILVAGDDPGLVEAARSGLAAEGAYPEVCPTEASAVAAAAGRGGPPAAVLALEGSEATLRTGLDPLGLQNGPPVVAAAEIAGPGESFDGLPARRLRALVQVHSL